MMFYWMLVFERIGWVVSPKDGNPHPANLKWTRSGGVSIQPGEDTNEVLKNVTEKCREDPDIPSDALLVNVVLIPSVLVPAVTSS